MQHQSTSSAFENMAKDPTAPRLRGFTVVQTELPAMMQSKTKAARAFNFRAAFLTTEHLYGFYYKSYQQQMLLARLCLFSQTWEKVPSFRLDIADDDDHFQAIPLPWEERSQILLFYPDHCKLLKLSNGSNRATALTNIDLRPLAGLVYRNTDIMVTDDMTIYIEWKQVVVDKESRTVFALLTLGVNEFTPLLALIRLDWTTQKWTSWRVFPFDNSIHRSLMESKFMAFHKGRLFLSVVQEESVPLNNETAWPFKQLQPLVGVLRINFTGPLVIDYHPVIGGPCPELLNHQVNLQFCPVGNTVFVLNAVLDQRNSKHVAKNQLWALNLSSLLMTQVNDGPQGGPQWSSAESSSAQSLMSRYTLVAAGDGSEMWALERALIRSTDQPQLIRMFRIGLQGVPSLGSMALQYLLLRRPLDSLMVFSAGDDRTRSGGKVRLRRQLRKQERTLPVLRAFVQRNAVLKAFGTQYLPKEE